MQAAREAGGGKVYILEEPLLSALGAGLDIDGPSGHMIVDIGGGTTDTAVLSMRDMVKEASTRVGGDAFDDAVVRYVRREYNLVIGEQTAEAAKMAVGSAFPTEKVEVEIRGRDSNRAAPSLVLTPGVCAKHQRSSHNHRSSSAQRS